MLSSIVTLRRENGEAFDATLQAYCDRIKPADETELALVEDMVSASWRLRRSMAIEKNMMDAAMDSLSDSLSDLDCLGKAFENLAATPQLSLLHGYQTRLHRMQSRVLRDLVFLRKAFPAPEVEVENPPNEPVTALPSPAVSADSGADAAPPSAPTETAAPAQDASISRLGLRLLPRRPAPADPALECENGQTNPKLL